MEHDILCTCILTNLSKYMYAQDPFIINNKRLRNARVSHSDQIVFST